jgi:glutathione reductase (NADPH)
MARDAMRVDETMLQFRHAVIAAGAEPVRLGITGAHLLASSEQFLAMGIRPSRIVFVGGGYIGAEFSHLAPRAGARVTVLQHGPRMVAPFEPDLVAMLMDRFRALGIDVRTRAAMEAIESRGGGVFVHARTPEERLAVEANLAVHAGGSAPDLAQMNLAAADIASENGRLRFLQSTSNPEVYAGRGRR